MRETDSRHRDASSPVV